MWFVSVSLQGEPAKDAITRLEHTKANSTVHRIARFDIADTLLAINVDPAVAARKRH
jgi:hypothetical protein